MSEKDFYDGMPTKLLVVRLAYHLMTVCFFVLAFGMIGLIFATMIYNLIR